MVFYNKERSALSAAHILQFNVAMSSSFKTIALIGKHKNPDIVAPLLRLGRYMEKPQSGGAAGSSYGCRVAEASILS